MGLVVEPGKELVGVKFGEDVSVGLVTVVGAACTTVRGAGAISQQTVLTVCSPTSVS
jgi:hypothetical protein